MKTRMVQAAPLLLAISVLARLLWSVLTRNGLNVVDLHVYVDGSAALLHNHLYDYTYSEKTPNFPLPFTYPPFAGLVFLPLHYLPFKAVAIGWLVATVAALYAVVRITQELLGVADRPDARNVAMLWTVVGMWGEPVRSTIDYGQVNAFLVLCGMLAVRTARPWLAGLLVGASAGIKLTPAVTGLYFAARRRWQAVVWSAAVFVGTVAISFLVIGTQSDRYFGTLFGDASRIGPVGSAWNQSLRGALSRIVGHDVGTGALWVVAVAAAAALVVAAWRSLDVDDRLGTLLLVEFFGLLASPISWSHHWVWIVPLLLWLSSGPARGRPGARLVAAFWAIDMMVGIPGWLSSIQESSWSISRSWPTAWLGAVNTVGVVALCVWLIWTGRRRAVGPREVVAAAIVDDGKLLLARRTEPPELAGLWELPGGKVERGETPESALRRELHEELGIQASIGGRVGVEVPTADGRWVLRAYRTTVVDGTPKALDHDAIRWVDAAELAGLDLVPNDRLWLDDLRGLLSESVH